MSIPDLIRDYGYWAVLVGTFFEGETLLILAGVAAQQGHLRLALVMPIAFVGSFLGDQLAYFVGWRFGPKLVARWPRWQARVERVRRILERHRVPILIGFRFVYGIRIAGPVAFGMSGIRPTTFAPLNAIGALTWSVLISGLGYLCGAAVTRVLDRVKHYQGFVIGGAVLIAAIVALIVHLRRRSAANRAAAEELAQAAKLAAVPLDDPPDPFVGAVPTTTSARP